MTVARAGTSPTPPSDPSGGPRARRFAVVRKGPRAGRIIAAGRLGPRDERRPRRLATSPFPDRYEYFRFMSEAIGRLDGAAPGGGDRFVAAIIDPTRPGVISRVVVSDDGGDMWRETFEITGDPNAASSEVVDLGGGRAVIAMDGGHIWRTEDAGETWRIVGVVPGALVDRDQTTNVGVSCGRFAARTTGCM